MTAASQIHSPSEIRRERCEDEDGNVYIVIVWRKTPGLSATVYTLDDGSPVEYDDECGFTIRATGKQISRCEPVGDPDDEAAVAEAGTAQRRHG